MALSNAPAAQTGVGRRSGKGASIPGHIEGGIADVVLLDLRMPGIDGFEASRVVDAGARLIGVNNRNLQTFEVDFDNTARLRDMVPADVIMVGESGIKNSEEILRMAEIGVDAVLVGETLVRSKDVYQTARSFVAAGQSNL